MEGRQGPVSSQKSPQETTFIYLPPHQDPSKRDNPPLVLTESGGSGRLGCRHSREDGGPHQSNGLFLSRQSSMVVLDFS